MSFLALVVAVTSIKLFLEMFMLLATGIAGLWAPWTYRQSVRLERSKWMKELYEKFYERSDLKQVRDLLDGGDQTKIEKLVDEESANFTDYLNFFEFLAYLWKSKQIGLDEIKGIFEYYLRNLKQNESAAGYIAERANGFEQLQKLLETIGQESSK
ncbi:MAG TPA: hypothetical protein VGX94_05040 [Terriglobia bacterium]|nr:hypothetical protein [Terriglobia bacterium]